MKLYQPIHRFGVAVVARDRAGRAGLTGQGAWAIVDSGRRVAVGWPMLGGRGPSGMSGSWGIAINTRLRFRAGLLAVGLCTGVVTSLLPAGSAAAAVPTPIGVDVS